MSDRQILVVDDEALVLLMIEDFLDQSGYSAVTALNATEAMEVINEGSDRFVAVITDIDLGQRSANGWEVAKRVRDRDPAMPVIYISGKSGADWQANGVPASVMLPKPFSVCELETTLKRLVGSAV